MRNIPSENAAEGQAQGILAAEVFNGFYIRKDYDFDVCYFNFIQENKFVRATHVMSYFPYEYHITPDKVFYETYGQHNLIKCMGQEFT